MSIDDTDYAILKCIKDLDRPLWKNKIHECISERIDELPIMAAVSVQTVGRRVDTLTEDGYLESAIISPEDIKRDLIIAFKLTEQGETAINEKTDEYLQRAVQNDIFASQEDQRIGKEALVGLIDEKFDLDEDTRELMQHEYSRDELIMLMTLYYVRKEISDAFTRENIEKFSDIAEKSGELSQALSRYMQDSES